MGYSENALRLRKPKIIELPHIDSRITYLYIEYTRLVQDETGVVAVQEVEGVEQVLHIPAASLAFIMLGPGTSITAAAMTTLHRSGTVVIYGGGDTTGYSSARSLSSRADWAQAQARMWADPDSRLRAARDLYLKQFEGITLPIDVPLRVLRGIEGAEIRSLYKKLAAEYRHVKWHRESDSEKHVDPVNPLLNLGNSVLYGAALAAVSALSLNPALGIIHSGSSSALLFDLADLYKIKSTIPLAFKLANEHNATAKLRTEMRVFLVKNKVLEDMLATLCELLSPYVQSAHSDTLLDDGGMVPGHVNYVKDHPGGD